MVADFKELHLLVVGDFAEITRPASAFGFPTSSIQMIGLINIEAIAPQAFYAQAHAGHRLVRPRVAHEPTSGSGWPIFSRLRGDPSAPIFHLLEYGPDRLAVDHVLEDVEVLFFARPYIQDQHNSGDRCRMPN